MEDVLDLYAEPYDPRRPQVRFDESPYQLVSETRHPLPVRPGQPAYYDYEYKREGTVNLFLLVQPLAGWRQVTVTARRTAQDFAQQMRDLVDLYFPTAEVIRIVLDQLNTHSPAALYETFPPAEARRLTWKLESHHTPKHGSWPNMAESELAVLNKQCLDRRIADVRTLRRAIAVWQAERNRRKAEIKWSFRTTAARLKLNWLYPPTPQASEPCEQPAVAA
jgi:DDE superfamily endonuclease